MARAMREQEVVRFRVAGFWRRLLAAALDAFVLAPFFAFTGLLLALGSGARIPRWRESWLDYVVELVLGKSPLAIGGVFLCVAIAGLYFTLFHAARGQTLGKQALGLQVITLRGVRPTIVGSLARTAAYVPSFLLCGLGFLWIGFDREKRGLHDWLAGTYVVRAP
ncbi:MAG TPA: RDD family protein [Polyangia bacterium]|nr:RDD family protein [Polyangia bacterium]